jgi:DNA mismatch repair protein MutS
MKAIGLCTVLAQTGFPVPASKFKIAPFTALFTRILGNDNLWAGLSSFAVEMSEFREVLQYSDTKTLVLGDELCSGTETVSATAIVAAGLETLASRRTKFLFATHLHELGSMPIPGVRVAHLAVHYDEATGVLVYDRTLREGSGSALYGLEVCKALGLPAAFLDRANQIRQSLVGYRKPTQSVYSKDSVVEACEVCGSTKGLETHHINHQATFTGPEKSLHAPHNLATLCSACHDDHHGGRLVIDGWEETSAGRRLIWNRPTQETFSPEVTAFIRLEKALKKPILTIIRVVDQLFGVKITAKQARAI